MDSAHSDAFVHGLRTPDIPNFWAWADNFWGIWGIFSQTISSTLAL